VTFVATIWLWLLAIALVMLMLRQYIRGTHELLSVRNVAIVGFLVFQVVAGATFLGGDAATRSGMHLERIGATSLLFALMATVFALMFLWAYDRGFVVRNLARRIPTTRAVPSHAMLWILAFGLVAVAAILRYAVQIPTVAIVTNIIAAGCAAAACGVAGWIWGPRLKNPVVLLLVAAVAISAVFIATTGAYGRRSLVGLGGAIIWGVYFSHLRYKRPAVAFMWLALVAAIPAGYVALFTAARDSGEQDRTAREQIAAIRHRGDVVRGFELLFKGQDAAQNSLWILETYPEQFEPRPFFTLYFVLIYPIPRAIWPDKPNALGQLLPGQAQLGGVRHDMLTLGAGIIGHIGAEGRWFALPIYAILGGLFIRLLDEIVRINPYTPLIVVPVGSTLGQVLGLARGETSTFMALTILGVTATYVIMFFLGKLAESSAAASQTQPYHLHDGWFDHEYADAANDSYSWADDIYADEGAEYPRLP
jgi:hypothetical protein